MVQISKRTDHYEVAEEAAREWCHPVHTTAEAAAVAQVHATLALVDAVDRLTDSYNGWRELGR